MLTKMNNKTIGGDGVAMGSPFKFSPYGKSGLEVSELFAKTAAHADEDWNIEQWGSDAEAEARRAHRWQDMKASSDLFNAVVRPDG